MNLIAFYAVNFVYTVLSDFYVHLFLNLEVIMSTNVVLPCHLQCLCCCV